MDGVGVHPDNGATRRHPHGQQIEDTTRAASQIDRSLSRTQVGPVQQAGAVNGQLLGLSPQPFRLTVAAAQALDGIGVLATSADWSVRLCRSAHLPPAHPGCSRRCRHYRPSAAPRKALSLRSRLCQDAADSPARRDSPCVGLHAV